MARRPKLAQEMVDEAIAGLGLDAWFRARISPMELTYLPTGQRAVFRRADDPLKLKGVKFARLRGSDVVREARPVRRHRRGAPRDDGRRTAGMRLRAFFSAN